MSELYVFDSSAWVEYFLGTKLGEKVDFLLKKGVDVVVPCVVVAEVTSKLIRLGVDERKAVSVLMTCLPAIEEREYFVEAGRLHAQKRKSDSNYPLADAMIKVLADKIGAKILTKDSHLFGPNTILLE